MIHRKYSRWVAALLAVPLLAACATNQPTPTAQGKPSGGQPGGGQRPVGVPVSVTPVERGSIAATLTYSGNIQSRASVNVLHGQKSWLFLDSSARGTIKETAPACDPVIKDSP